MKRKIIALGVIILLTGCASIDHTLRLRQPLDRPLVAGPGDIVLRIDCERNLENVFGKADIFGRKTKEGFSELRFAGVESTGEIVLFRKDTDIITNETTLSRMPISSTFGHTTTSLSGTATTAGNTVQLQGTGTTNHASTTINPATDFHVVVPSDSVALRLLPNEKRIPIAGYIIEIISATRNALEYRVTKQQ